MSERRLTDAEIEASRWIARLEASDVSLRDHDEFRAWLSASEENRLAHERLSATWDRLDALKLDPGLAGISRRRGLPRRALLAGIGGLTVAGAATSVWLAGARAVYAASFETPIGGRETAYLADGSELELNAATEIEARFTGRRRDATLVRGEAVFNIVSDPRPFRLTTPHGYVSAPGPASFVARLTPDAARVSVITGTVAGELGGQGPLTVGVREEVLLSHGSASTHPVTEQRLAGRVAWREGMLAFDGDRLADAAFAVSQQTGATFEFADPSLGELRIGGYIRASDLQAFVSLLEQNLDIRATSNGQNFILSR